MRAAEQPPRTALPAGGLASVRRRCRSPSGKKASSERVQVQLSDRRRRREESEDGRSIDQDRLTHPLHALLGGLATELQDFPIKVSILFSVQPMGKTDRRRPFQLHIKRTLQNSKPANLTPGNPASDGDRKGPFLRRSAARGRKSVAKAFLLRRPSFLLV